MVDEKGKMVDTKELGMNQGSPKGVLRNSDEDPLCYTEFRKEEDSKTPLVHVEQKDVIKDVPEATPTNNDKGK